MIGEICCVLRCWYIWSYKQRSLWLRGQSYRNILYGKRLLQVFLMRWRQNGSSEIWSDQPQWSCTHGLFGRQTRLCRCCPLPQGRAEHSDTQDDGMSFVFLMQALVGIQSPQAWYRKQQSITVRLLGLIQIYNLFSGFLLFRTSLLQMADEPILLIPEAILSYYLIRW